MSSRAAAVELDVDAAAMVVERLGPWNRGRCACVNQTWKRAVDEVCFPDDWLVQADGNRLLLMTNLGRVRVVELDLPWDSFTCDPEAVNITRTSRVLCSFQGLLLIGLGQEHSHALCLGDPLLNKWIKLPSPHTFLFISTCAFCPFTWTLMVTNLSNSSTATFDLTTAEWSVDPYGGEELGIGCPSSRPCCLRGVFYTIFQPYRTNKYILAYYDPEYSRRWRKMNHFVKRDAFFMAQLSYDKMLLYIKRSGGDYRLFEASRVSGSYELEIVPWEGLDQGSIGCRVWPGCKLLREDPMEGFHGQDGMPFWEGFDNKRDKITVASLDDREVKELDCTRSEHDVLPCYFHYFPCRFYYSPAPGTVELLDYLAQKLREKPANDDLSFW